jgi:hypothetical protein
MMYHEVPEDLFEHFMAPPRPPVMYQRDGNKFAVIDEMILNTFSADESLHDYAYVGRQVKCQMEYIGGRAEGRRYAGPIVVYVSEDLTFYIKPSFEFNDGSFTKVED